MILFVLLSPWLRGVPANAQRTVLETLRHAQRAGPCQVAGGSCWVSMVSTSRLSAWRAMPARPRSASTTPLSGDGGGPSSPLICGSSATPRVAWRRSLRRLES